jgi:hypothetical protein
MKRGSNRGNNGYIGVHQADTVLSGVVTPNKLYNIEMRDIPYQPFALKDALGFTATAVYQRPTEWPILPDVTAGTQQIVGLFAVYNNESNACAVQIQGAYSVDWGDGTTGNFASNAIATKRYDQTTYEGLTSSVVTSRGGQYKTALIKITPQSGSNFTSVDFCAYPAITGWATTNRPASTNWLDIRMAGANVTTLTVSKWFYNSIPNTLLEQFEYVGPAALTSMSFISAHSLQRITQFPSTRNVAAWASMFHTCYALQEMPASILDGLVNNAATSASACFYYCFALKSLPVAALDLRRVADLSNLFTTCGSLERSPTLVTTNTTTNMSSVYSTCYRLREIPQFTNTNSVTNMSSMFSSCYSLRTPPSGLSTGNVTNFSSMFSNCASLVSAPPLNTSKGSDMSLMFAGCGALRTIPQYDYSKVTTLSQFGRYSAIQYAPRFNTGLSLTNTSFMWEFNTRLLDVPIMDNITNVTNVSQMFNGTESIRTIPGITLGNPTTTANMFGTYTSGSLAFNKHLTWMDMKGISFSFNLFGAMLGSTALNNIYTNLATVGVSGANAKVLGVTGNWGYTASNKMIAISKGWSVP